MAPPAYPLEKSKTLVTLKAQGSGSALFYLEPPSPQLANLPQSIPKMSLQSYRPLIWASSILLFCILLGGIFYVKHDRELRVKAAQARWVNIQKKAAASGIHTNVDSYIEATSGDGPSLFNDFPALNDLFDPVINVNPFSIDKLPDLKEIPTITAAMSQLERSEKLR